MSEPKRITRRGMIRGAAACAAAIGLGGVLAKLAPGSLPRRTVWQIDPSKCIACGKCATNCVLKTSAVKCVHAFALCGYCDLCTGYFEAQPNARNSGAENQLCPVGAIQRTFVEDPYYQYTIDESKCVGCGKCVRGCNAFGNGSLFLQVRHNVCVNCNQCSIAMNCPAGAFRRVSADHPYLLKDNKGAAE